MPDLDGLLVEGVELCVRDGLSPVEAAEKLVANHRIVGEARDRLVREGLRSLLSLRLHTRRVGGDGLGRTPTPEAGCEIEGRVGEVGVRSGKYQLASKPDEGARWHYLSSVIYQGADGKMKPLLRFERADWDRLLVYATEQRRGFDRLVRLAKLGADGADRDRLELECVKVFGRKKGGGS